MRLARILVVIVTVIGLWLAPPAWAQWGTTELPALNAPAPTFHLPDEQGRILGLEDLRGSWVVLYFYPKDFTSGCTIEARRFQQNLEKFRAIQAQVIGISTDSVESHQRFCNAEGLQFTLLSDVDGAVSRLYGSWLGQMALRNSFLIDPDGVLREIFPIVNPSMHSTEVLAKLKDLQRA